MKTEITRPTWDDIVFESRNKEYGAFPIRKSYDENVSKAALIALVFAAFVFGVLQIASLMHVKIKIPVSISDPTGFTIPPTIIPNPPVKSATAKVEQSVNRDVLEKVVTYQVDPVPIKPTEATLSEPGTSSGIPSDGVDAGISPMEIPVVVDPPTTVDFAEMMPQYEGGMNAMMNFLRRNLRYPASARSIGEEGIVYVRFIVNSRGEIVDVEAIKGVSAVLDREAMRVVGLMRKWKPGMQHDVPVNVRMVLPIKFKLEQE
jgi:protein TonB